MLAVGGAAAIAAKQDLVSSCHGLRNERSRRSYRRGTAVGGLTLDLGTGRQVLTNDLSGLGMFAPFISNNGQAVASFRRMQNGVETAAQANGRVIENCLLALAMNSSTAVFAPDEKNP